MLQNTAAALQQLLHTRSALGAAQQSVGRASCVCFGIAFWFDFVEGCV